MDRALAGAVPHLRDPSDGSLSAASRTPEQALSMSDQSSTPRRQPPNLRTALVLLSIAAVFFAGVIVKRTFF